MQFKVRDRILERLRNAALEHSVRILYACESGSRAWGFASPDSGYDVRFSCVRERDWYLSFDIERRRDVIEYPIRYIEHGKRIPPVQFEALVDAVGRCIESELERHGALFSGQGRPDVLDSSQVRDELNTIFRRAVTAAA